jgi:FolB domain-containing protein
MAAATLFNPGECMDKILIKDLLTRGVIGISDLERSQPQDILFNIIVYTDIHAAGLSDNVEDAVNYRTISKKILAHASSVGRNTVEALAEDTANMILEDPKVLGVCVRVEKPGAVRFARSAGVEIERMRGK